MIAMLMTGIASAQLNLSYDAEILTDVDSFSVTLNIKGWKGDSAVFQMATTAPGTYSVLDAGRFVGSFRAFDAYKRPLIVKRTSVNQFVIRPAGFLSRITYRVDDTFGHEAMENPVLPMSGTNIEKDNAVVNTQMLFGYFAGFQSTPIRVTYRYPEKWKIGTALPLKDGAYYAKDFDQLVDSPAMMGRLTRAETKMGKSKIEVYCFSESEKISADLLLTSMREMLGAAEKFLGELPVEKYAFLFHIRENTGPIYGAWEHNYCSFYVIPEFSPDRASSVVMSIAAHEFFHVVIPLNIHSEIIQTFNFEKPVASRHLWLYEGVTEWASDLMQIRGGIMSDTSFMDEVTDKLQTNDRFNPNVSLVDMSIYSYDSLADQYQNIYNRGALTAMLLDMRLLELSNGKMGLMDVVRKLSKSFGPQRAFPDNLFFDLIVQMTFPEIRDFITRYIEGHEVLPMAGYLAKAGYTYEAKAKTGRTRNSLGVFQAEKKDSAVLVTSIDPGDSVIQRLGIKVGDEVMKLSVNRIELPVDDASTIEFFSFFDNGTPFSWVVRRDGKTLKLKGFVGQREIIETHKITPLKNSSAEQIRFRKWWFTNR